MSNDAHIKDAAMSKAVKFLTTPLSDPNALPLVFDELNIEDSMVRMRSVVSAASEFVAKQGDDKKVIDLLSALGDDDLMQGIPQYTPDCSASIRARISSFVDLEPTYGEKMEQLFFPLISKLVYDGGNEPVVTKSLTCYDECNFIDAYVLPREIDDLFTTIDEMRSKFTPHLRYNPFNNKMIVLCQQEQLDSALDIAHEVMRESPKAIENHASIIVAAIDGGGYLDVRVVSNCYKAEARKDMDTAIAVFPAQVKEELESFLGDESEYIERIFPSYFQLSLVSKHALFAYGITPKQFCIRLLKDILRNGYHKTENVFTNVTDISSVIACFTLDYKKKQEAYGDVVNKWIFDIGDEGIDSPREFDQRLRDIDNKRFDGMTRAEKIVSASVDMKNELSRKTADVFSLAFMDKDDLTDMSLDHRQCEVMLNQLNQMAGMIDNMKWSVNAAMSLIDGTSES